ncbi:MAG: GTP-binding protein HSR1 [Wenzhouxiangella sp.]|nr:MAG: GTP-binding protein HSR1 [Wenzhouxiangella sp.]
MKTWLQGFGRLRAAALVVGALPLAALPVLGTVWLWQNSQILVWVGVAVLAAMIGLGLNQLAVRREQAALPESGTAPAEHWTPRANECWQRVENLAESVTPDDYPLSDGAALMRLARDVLNLAADHFHPGARQPLLEMTVPHTLAVIERAARELRGDIAEHIPFSHRLSLGDMARVGRWRDWYRRNEVWIRTGRALLAPQSAVVAELRRIVSNQTLQHGSRQVQTWLLREYVRKLGFHAIELYGGFARIDERVELDSATPASRRDAETTGDEASAEPLRWLVAGRSNAGKSSLINALFDDLVAAVDLLPDSTSDIQAFRLEKADNDRILIFDTPGTDTALEPALVKLLESTDMLLWVSAANRADRRDERQALDRLRGKLTAPDRIPPPVLVVMTHIDRLRPLREWDPPYRLQPPDRPKGEQIVAAAESLARDLAVPAEDIVPVCLRSGDIWNVDDALWTVLIARQDASRRVRLLRCLKARRREENWSLLARQLRQSGRLLGRTVRAALGRDAAP